MLDFYRKWLAVAGRAPEYTEDDLAAASVGEMREMAKHYKIKGRSKLDQHSLYDALLNYVERVPKQRPALFVELCAGTAALSLRLQAKHARPPVSRMGAKTGYADAILRVMGLRAGLGAEHYLWCEPDPGCRLLLEAYRDRELAQAAADIIRGWKDEDPRALWERLRAEGPVKEDGGAREVGWEWLLGAWAAHGKDRSSYGGPGRPGGSETEREGTARRGETATGLPATILPDARTADPREVAKYVQLVGSNRLVPGCWSEDGRWVNAARDGGPGTKGGISFGGLDFCTTPEANVASLAALPVLPATILPDAHTVEPVPPLPPRAIAYMDPPYAGTTGYAADLPRSEVVRLARLWHEAGARVYISEAEPLGELDSWHRVEITTTRKGQKRTFSKQQREWLTCSHPPAWTP